MTITKNKINSFNNIIKMNDVEKLRSIYDYIFIKKDHFLYKIKIHDIKWIKSEGNYLDIHCIKSKHLIRYSLKEFINQLPSDIFIQVHRSYIVNIHFVDAFAHRMLKIGNIYIPIGQSFVRNIQNKLNILL